MGLNNLLNIYLDFVKKLVPAVNIKPVVGMDIGTSACKMVEVKVSASAVELVNWAIEPVPNGDIKQAVRNVLNKLKVPTANVFTAVYGKGTLVRYLDMPRMNLEEMKKSFAFEVDKYFPFPKDQIYTDCCILNAKEKDNKMLVLAAAGRKEMISQRMDFLKELGLEADFVGLNSMAVANLVNFHPGKKTDESLATGGDKPAALAVLDIGERVSNLTILVQGEPRFTRDIFIGGNELTSGISNALSIDLKAAEALKFSPGDKAEEVLRASESMIMNLTSEVRLSFDYFLTEKNIAIPDLVLTGGGSSLAGLPEIFSKYLEMNVRWLDPLAGLIIADHISKEELKKNASRLSVALGLALSAS